MSEDEIFRVPVGYYFQNEVLMRKWRPADVPAEADWSVKHQIVLPKSFRTEVLYLAHKNTLSGHLGITKTYKLLNHFFWSLQPIPAFEEPLKSKSGNEYLLTITSTSTRFSVAIPLRNIKAKTIVKARIKFFTLVGLPKSIQSDQGSKKNSNIYSKMTLLNHQKVSDRHHVY